MAAEQIGWLGGTAEKQEKTWAARMTEAGKPLPMVAIEAGQYLMDMMMDMRPVQSNGWGHSAKPDAEIRSYAAGLGIDLLPWEFLTLRRMCRSYLDGMNSAKDRLSIPPMRRQLTNNEDHHA